MTNIAEGTRSTCQHCGLEIEWRYDRAVWHDEDLDDLDALHPDYGFWYTVEQGWECCPTEKDDTEGWHRPLGAEVDNGWPEQGSAGLALLLGAPALLLVLLVVVKVAAVLSAVPAAAGQ